MYVVQDEKGDLVTGSHRKLFLSCSVYMGLMMLGRQKYTQQSHQCLSRDGYCNAKKTNHQVLIKSQQNLLLLLL